MLIPNNFCLLVTSIHNQLHVNCFTLNIEFHNLCKGFEEL